MKSLVYIYLMSSFAAALLTADDLPPELPDLVRRGGELPLPVVRRLMFGDLETP